MYSIKLVRSVIIKFYEHGEPDRHFDTHTRRGGVGETCIFFSTRASFYRDTSRVTVDPLRTFASSVRILSRRLWYHNGLSFTDC